MVDDDEGIREVLRLALEFEGYQVIVAANGQEGLDILAQDPIPPPCLILLDLMMPEVNGWKFVEEIEKDLKHRDIPIIVLTAFPFEARTIHAKEILTKPIDLDVLQKTIEKYCKGVKDS